MYPQNTVARASSVATAPAQQLPQPPVSRQGPTHPYGMYPQNTVEDEVPLPVVQATIPVGFPGLPAGYHRQIGPDGEEQDIIGPDGHSEQLPPYTRFPQEGPTKAALAAEMNSSPVEATAVPAVPAVSAHRSNDALVSPVSPTSSISSLSSSRFEAPTQPQLPPQEEQRQAAAVVAASIPVVSTEQLLSEKQEPARNEKPKNWRSKKLWGILPMGVALILLILVLIFAVILGAAIGTFVAKNKDKGPNENKNKDKDHDDP
jgi:Na+-transporting methylmalonyl-CoA/oxaloacetate decarboxylase gamma subunit